MATELDKDFEQPVEATPPALKNIKFDLSAEEFVTIVTLPSQRDLLIHYSIPTADEIKKLLSALNLKVRVKKRHQMELQAADSYKCKPVFHTHFRHMEFADGSPVELKPGTPMTPDQQLTWIKTNPGQVIEEAVILGHFLQIELDDEEVETETFDNVLDANLDRKVPTTIRIYDPTDESLTPIRIVHSLRPITEQDQRRYRRAVGTTEMQTKSREWNRVENHTAKEKLYDDLVTGVEGVFLGGEPLTEENKSTWIHHVWYQWKNFVMDQAFTGVELKNE